MYVSYDLYQNLYSDDLDEEMFNRLAYNACRKVDALTTGIDNVRKLKVAFPTDEDDALAVRRCICEMINIGYQIEQAKASADTARGFITREDGTVQGRMVTSISAGNESISFSTSGGSSTATFIDKALTDRTVQEKLYSDTVKEFLSGVPDANGVNLLYMGKYPRIN